MDNVPLMPATEVHYATVADRRVATDGMMWQAPFLSLTAQAFLLTIALAKDSEPAARVVAATLALLSAMASVQLMAKHRYYERMDTEWLKLFEAAHYSDNSSPPTAIHNRNGDAMKNLLAKESEKDGFGWPITQYLANVTGSYHLWMTVLALFAMGAASVLVITYFNPALLAGRTGCGSP